LPLRVTTSKNIYPVGETVKILVKNVGEKPVQFPNVALGMEISRRGKTVYSPIVILSAPEAQVLPPPLQPGEEKELTWNQESSEGIQVGPDVYTATISPVKEKPVSKSFVVGEPPAGILEDILHELGKIRELLEKKPKKKR